jgi:hypothetical protein
MRNKKQNYKIVWMMCNNIKVLVPENICRPRTCETKSCVCVCVCHYSVLEHRATSNCTLLETGLSWIQDDSLRRAQINNYKSTKIYRLKLSLETLCTSRKLNPMPACSVRTISAIGAIQLDMLATNIREHGASCGPASLGARNPISASSSIQFSQRLPKYVYTKFRFHR